MRTSAWENNPCFYKKQTGADPVGSGFLRSGKEIIRKRLPEFPFYTFYIGRLLSPGPRRNTRRRLSAGRERPAHVPRGRAVMQRRRGGSSLPAHAGTPADGCRRSGSVRRIFGQGCHAKAAGQLPSPGPRRDTRRRLSAGRERPAHVQGQGCHAKAARRLLPPGLRRDTRRRLSAGRERPAHVQGQGCHAKAAERLPSPGLCRNTPPTAVGGAGAPGVCSGAGLSRKGGGSVRRMSRGGLSCKGDGTAPLTQPAQKHTPTAVGGAGAPGIYSGAGLSHKSGGAASLTRLTQRRPPTAVGGAGAPGACSGAGLSCPASV